MNLRILLLSFSFVVSCQLLASVDTTTIVKWNDEALELAYSNPKEALIVAGKSLKASRDLGFKRGEVRALIRFGIIYDVTAKNKLAIKYYKKSLQLSYKTNDTRGIGSNLNNLGLIYYKVSEFQSALNYFHRAYAVFKSSNDQTMLGSVTNNIGLIYDELFQYHTSRYWYEKALKHYKNANEDYLIYDVYANIGLNYDKIQKYDSAIFHIQKAVSGYRKTNNQYGLCKSLANLALIYRIQKKHDLAIPLFHEAIEFAKSLGNTNSEVSGLYNLARCYKFIGHENKSFELLKKAYPKLSGLQSNELGFKVCLDLALCYLRRNESKTGERIMNEYLDYHTSYYSETMNTDLLFTQQKFRLKEQQHLAAFRIKSEKQKRERENLLWAGGVMLIILVGLLIFFIFRKTNLQEELEGQKAIFEATMEERRRISYDLHDHVGSQLSYVVNNLELMRHTDQSNQRINRTYEMSQTAMSSLRDTVWTLRAEEITISHLSQRMENVFLKVLENNPEISTGYYDHLSSSLILAPQTTMNVMRIFQEAVHNIVKHAKATKVYIELKEDDKDFQLIIQDNGIGLIETEIKPFHYGMVSMKERASKINGTISFSGKENEGTRVTLIWKK